MLDSSYFSFLVLPKKQEMIRQLSWDSLHLLHCVQSETELLPEILYILSEGKTKKDKKENIILGLCKEFKQFISTCNLYHQLPFVSPPSCKKCTSIRTEWHEETLQGLGQITNSQNTRSPFLCTTSLLSPHSSLSPSMPPSTLSA